MRPWEWLHVQPDPTPTGSRWLIVLMVAPWALLAILDILGI